MANKNSARFVVGDPGNDLKGLLTPGRFILNYDMIIEITKGRLPAGTVLEFRKEPDFGTLEGLTQLEDTPCAFKIGKKHAVIHDLLIPAGKDLGCAIVPPATFEPANKVEIDVTIERRTSRLGAHDQLRGTYRSMLGGIKLYL
jgi:hypothetical protein